MSARDDFLSWVGTELRAAETATHNGDADLRRTIWSSTEPVTVFGAVTSAVGRSEIDDLFDMLEGKFSDCRSYRYDVVAADVVDDMAYTAGYEHTQATVDGEPRTYTLRVTQVYRRHGDAWQVVHRHADTPPEQATSSGRDR